MSRILQYAKTTPWAILPEALESILEIAAREHTITPDAIERMRGERLEDTARARIREGIAIIPVHGPIFRYANLFTAFSGATSTEVLANDVGEALENPKVKGIIFEIDSPGGMVNGLAEVSELIFRARAEKPTASFISGLGASAGYYIASSAARVFADKSAIVGSIGTVLEVADFKGAQAKAGIRTLEFVSAQSPRKRVDPFDSDEGRAKAARSDIQNLVDSIAQVFVDDVARNRGVSVETVLDDFGEGGVFVGEAALEAGLVDGITTLEDLIAEMSEDARSRGSARFSPAAGGHDRIPEATPKREAVMSDKGKAGGDAQPEINRAYLAANHPELVSEIQAEGATAERDRIAAIQALNGPEAIVAECLADPTVTAGDAAVRILEAQKVRSQGQADAHLEGRAAAEVDPKAPAPSTETDSASSDDRARARRIVALHNQMQGRDVVARA